LGCDPKDYAAVTKDNIAIVSRGNCSFADKILLAANAGAAALLIYNQGDALTPDRMGIFIGSLGGDIRIPAFSLTYELGMALLDTTGLQLNFFLNAVSYNVTTWNVLASTKRGDPTSAIIIGSHLDSVPAGPGINDNGSGSSVNLELAIQLYQMMIRQESPIDIVNRVTFAWWAAEEVGLQGSKWFVAKLNETNGFVNISMNINMDMLGSPNFFRGIHNGSMAEAHIRSGSEAIQHQFESAYKKQSADMKFELTPFDGRSDYGPFIANGIPAGGINTGAEKLKDATGRDLYGGLANAAFDPCYHQYCDTVANIHQGVLTENAKACGTVLEFFATQRDIKSYLKNYNAPSTTGQAATTGNNAVSVATTGSTPTTPTPATTGNAQATTGNPATVATTGNAATTAAAATTAKPML